MSRKYQAALLLGKVDEKSVHHLLEKNPKAVPLADRLSELGDQLKKCDTKSKSKYRRDCADPYVLADKVERLENYIDDLNRQHLEEVSVLKDTLDQYDLKFDSMKAQYVELLQSNSKALDETRQMLSVAVHENLELRHELLKKDDKFLQIQMDEINNAVRKRPSQAACSKDDISQAFEDATAVEKQLKVRLARTEIELVEKSNILRDATSKMLMLERKCSNLEDEMAAMKKSHQSCIVALKNRNEVLEKRCEKTDERRKLDNAGFREDVQELKQLLKNLSRSVQKCIKLYGDTDLEKQGYSKPQDEILNDILVSGGLLGGAQKLPDTAKSSGSVVDRKAMQKAMTIWTDYLGRKIEDLDEKVSGTKIEVLYKNEAKQKPSTNAFDYIGLKKKPEVPRNLDTDYNIDY